MEDEKSLASYFNAEELDEAKKYVEDFHGRFLLSNELGRKDATLLGLYMLCNREKKSEVAIEMAREFVVRQLGISSKDYPKAIYELKSENLLSENEGKLSPTFKGIKKIRELLISNKQQEPSTSPETSSEEIPSIGAPDSLKDAIKKLFSSKWGTKPRKLTDVVEALETNTLYYPKAAVATELAKLTKLSILRRMKSKDGHFQYVAGKKSPEGMQA